MQKKQIQQKQISKPKHKNEYIVHYCMYDEFIS
jgi:hypothetical protein